MERQPLATLVAPVPNQLAPPQTLRTNHRRFAAFLSAALTLLALAVHGYHPYADDGGLYAAGVKRLLNPALYPQGTAFVLEPMRFSLFAPFVAAVVRLTHLSLPLALLLLHLASIWATLFAAWLLAARLWPSRAARAGAVVLLACWLSLPVAGTALVLMDPYLTARSISTPCTLVALSATLDLTELSATQRSRLRSLILILAAIAIAAAVHPLMAAYAFAATLLLAVLRAPNPRLRLIGTSSLIAAAMLLAAALQATAPAESAAYRGVALTRTYWYLSRWSWYELIGLLAPLFILGIYAFAAPHRSHLPARRVLARMALAAGSAAILAAAIFAHAGAESHLIARMQPLRIFHTVYLVMTLILGAQLGSSLLRRRARRWAAAVLLLGGTMCLVSLRCFPNSRHVELPWTAPRNPWTQAFLWVRGHTPQNALFALDPDYINLPGEDAQCFRAVAERSALPDYSKDGGEASIAPSLASAWQSGQLAQQPLRSPAARNSPLSQANLAALAQRNVTWLVLDARARTSLDCPYSNAAAKVCRLR